MAQLILFPSHIRSQKWFWREFDKVFTKLKTALDADDLDKAFEEAHKLKGMLANLSLNPILKPLSELTELLRHKTGGDYLGLYHAVMEKKAELEGQ